MDGRDSIKHGIMRPFQTCLAAQGFLVGHVGVCVCCFSTSVEFSKLSGPCVVAPCKCPFSVGKSDVILPVS